MTKIVVDLKKCDSSITVDSISFEDAVAEELQKSDFKLQGAYYVSVGKLVVNGQIISMPAPLLARAMGDNHPTGFLSILLSTVNLSNHIKTNYVKPLVFCTISKYTLTMEVAQ